MQSRVIAAGDAEPDARQDTDGPPGYQSTLLNFVEVLISQYFPFLSV